LPETRSKVTTTAQTERQIKELEKLAAQVLELKRRVRPRRPIVIEFAGSPKAGKTTAINSLEIFLRRNGFRTKVLTERASVCPIPNKFDPIFNVWTGCAALNQLMETLSTGSRSLDVVIMDRGFFDALCWFEWQREQGHLRRDDHDRFANFFLAPRFRMVVDLVLAFEASPETSIDREYSNLLTRKEGSVMRKDVLDSYLQVIEKSIKRYSPVFRHIVRFNTDDVGQNEASYKTTKMTLEKLRGIADEKIGHIPKSALSSNLETVFHYSQIAGAVEKSLEYGDRSLVEEDHSLVQIIPIAVIKQAGQPRLMVARKAEKAVSSKSPEKGKLLTYFGGHVREEDSSFQSDSSKLDIFRQCLYREVKEEIGIDVDPVDVDPFCIWVRDGSKSDYHLAVVFIVERDLSNIRITVDGEELVRYEKKGRTGTGEVVSASDLISDGKIDSWSRNIIDNVLRIGTQVDPFQKGLFDPVPSS